jgi:hypothetical protein
MSNWIKIDDDLRALPATPDPQDVVSISALASEITDLQSRIDSIHLIEIPKDASDEIKEAINEKNGFLVANDIAPLQNELEQKQQFLNELKAI